MSCAYVWDWAILVATFFQCVKTLRFQNDYLHSYSFPRERFLPIKSNQPGSDYLQRSYTHFLRSQIRNPYINYYIRFPVLKPIGHIELDNMCQDLYSGLSLRKNMYKPNNYYRNGIGKPYGSTAFRGNVFSQGSYFSPFVKGMMKYRHRNKKSRNSNFSQIGDKKFIGPVVTVKKVNQTERIPGPNIEEIQRFPFNYKNINTGKTSCRKNSDLPSFDRMESIVLPSKIIIANFSSWKSPKKNEIETNNISLSMFYDFLPCTENNSTSKHNVSHSSGKLEITRKPFIGKDTSFLSNKNISNPIVSDTKILFEQNNLLPMTRTCEVDSLENISGNVTEMTMSGVENTTEPVIIQCEDYLCECHLCDPGALQEEKSFHSNVKTKTAKTEEDKIQHISRIKKSHLFKKVHLLKELKNMNILNKNFNTSKDLSILIIPENEFNSSGIIYMSKINDTSVEENSSVVYNYTTIKKGNISEKNRFKRKTFKCNASRKGKRKRAFVSIQFPITKHNNKTHRYDWDSNAQYPRKAQRNRFRSKKLHKKGRTNDCKKISETKKNITLHRKNSGLNKKTKEVSHRRREFVEEGNGFPNYTDTCDRTVTYAKEAEVRSTSMTFHHRRTTHTFLYTLFHETQTDFFEPTQHKTTHHGTTHPEKIRLETSTLETTTPILVVLNPTAFQAITTVQTKEVIDTGNRNPAKLLCEENNQVECACYISTVFQDFNKFMYNVDDEKFLLAEMPSYNCSDYRPMKPKYTVSSVMKPRLISNKKKEFVADEEKGPKEVISETFEQLMLRDIPDEGIDFYVLPNSDFEIPCFINDEVQLSPNSADSASYKWRYGKDQKITGGRITEDLNHKGMLKITGATITDSENYTCTVTYRSPGNGDVIRNSFVHSLYE